MSGKTEFQQEVGKRTKKPGDREQAWLDEEIEIEFYNLEEPGLMLKFPYGSTKNPQNYTLMHGGTYTLPRRVVNHLESRGTPMWKWTPDGNGSLTKELQGKKSRFQCRQKFV